jgi:plastocyanin
MVKQGIRIGGRFGIVLVLAIVVSGGLVFAQSLVTTRAAKTRTVELYGDDMNNIYQFIPQNITVNVGDTINWTDVSGQHSATSNPGQGEWWDSGILNPGQFYLFTFTVPGVYTYWSTFPWHIDMVGTVTVQQPAPEFPGFTLVAAIAFAVAAGLLIERKLRA